MKRVLSFVLMVVFAFVLAAPAFAINSTEIAVERIDLENGDYITITTGIFTGTARAFRQTGFKTYEYTSGGKLMWIYSMEATFEYDGSTAKAIDADDFYYIYDVAWSCASKSTRCSGATAYGYAYFKTGTSGQTVDLRITCSPNGAIS